jgi:hypothetical protein
VEIHALVTSLLRKLRTPLSLPDVVFSVLIMQVASSRC